MSHVLGTLFHAFIMPLSNITSERISDDIKENISDEVNECVNDHTTNTVIGINDASNCIANDTLGGTLNYRKDDILNDGCCFQV